VLPCLDFFWLDSALMEQHTHPHIQVADRGILRNVEMLATRESLQDLLYKVKDAVKQVDRAVASLRVG
jgi:hypothetical protein